jgi:hypothetical protein
MYVYTGDYENYVEKKAARIESELASIDKAKNTFRKELEWMRKQPKARTTKSKSRQDNFYEVEAKAKTKIEDAQLQLEVKMSRLGGKIVEMKKVYKSYGDKPILKGFDYTLQIVDKLIPLGFSFSAFGPHGYLLQGRNNINFIQSPSDSELANLYSQHEYFLQTSIHEGLSLPPIEAMSQDCIPIVTEAHGNLDYIKDGKNVIIISRNLNMAVNKISNLSWKISIKKMRQYMRETTSHYSWEECFKRLKKIINLIDKTPRYGLTKFF